MSFLKKGMLGLALGLAVRAVVVKIAAAKELIIGVS